MTAYHYKKKLYNATTAESQGTSNVTVSYSLQMREELILAVNTKLIATEHKAQANKCKVITQKLGDDSSLSSNCNALVVSHALSVSATIVIGSLTV